MSNIPVDKFNTHMYLDRAGMLYQCVVKNLALNVGDCVRLMTRTAR